MEILFATSTDTKNINAALAKFKGAVLPVVRGDEVSMDGTSRAGNAYNVKYKYAPLEAIQKAAQKPLAENELCVNQFITVMMIGDKMQEGILTRVGHSSGEWLQAFWPIFGIDKAFKEQERGSKITYNKRYAYGAALDIPIEDETDDDANSADETGNKAAKKALGQTGNKSQGNQNQGKPQGNKAQPPQGAPPPAKKKEEDKSGLSQTQLVDLFAAKSKAKWKDDDLKKVMNDIFGVQATKDMNNDQYDEVMHYMTNSIPFAQAIKDMWTAKEHTNFAAQLPNNQGKPQ